MHLTSTKSTRIHQPRFKHLSAKTDTFKNSYFPRTIVDWNALPPAVIEATTTDDQFKGRLKNPSKPSISSIFDPTLHWRNTQSRRCQLFIQIQIQIHEEAASPLLLELQRS